VANNAGRRGEKLSPFGEKRLGCLSEGAPVPAPVRTPSMTDDLWDQLPAGFLMKSPIGWTRLDRDVRRLVVELAREQKFKCAFCDKAKGLIIEHDHWPERGSGDKLTIYNVRGLAR
jgi:hypothetical protein